MQLFRVLSPQILRKWKRKRDGVREERWDNRVNKRRKDRWQDIKRWRVGWLTAVSEQVAHGHICESHQSLQRSHDKGNGSNKHRTDDMFHMDVFHSGRPSRQVASHRRHEHRLGQINCDHSEFYTKGHILLLQVLHGWANPDNCVSHQHRCLH